MLVVLKDRIINIEQYDTVFVQNDTLSCDVKGYDIVFTGENKVNDYVSYSDKSERDAEWNRIKSMINNWYK